MLIFIEKFNISFSVNINLKMNVLNENNKN